MGPPAATSSARPGLRWRGLTRRLPHPRYPQEEKEFLKAGLDALGKKEEQITQVDALQIVRGYHPPRPLPGTRPPHESRLP